MAGDFRHFTDLPRLSLLEFAAVHESESGP